MARCRRAAGALTGAMGVLLLPLAAAHVHGQAGLDVAIEDARIELALYGAGEGFVGFEHGAQTPQEQAAIASAQARLARLDELLRIGQACRRDTVQVMAHEIAAAGAHEHEHEEGGHHEHESVHAGHAGHAGHAEWRVEAVYVCEGATRGLRLDARALFAAFPQLHSIQLRALTAEAQMSGQLTPEVSAIELP